MRASRNSGQFRSVRGRVKITCDLLVPRSHNGALLRDQGKVDEAERLYEGSQSIREQVLGPEHPSVVQSLNIRAAILEKQASTWRIV